MHPQHFPLQTSERLPNSRSIPPAREPEPIPGARSSVDAACCGFLTAGARSPTISSTPTLQKVDDLGDEVGRPVVLVLKRRSLPGRPPYFNTHPSTIWDYILTHVVVDLYCFEFQRLLNFFRRQQVVPSMWGLFVPSWSFGNLPGLILAARSASSFPQCAGATWEWVVWIKDWRLMRIP